jgi:hypothetical protein
METGGFVKVDSPKRDRRPSAAQTIKRPPIEEKQNLIHAADPSGQT